ncbi:DMT family transporter [Candidatus Microgenomates bacterium]|nr:MAG: DMT family transporter [Candidatus Microgenomates bacterium]
MSQRKIALIAILTAAFFWSTAAVVSKILLQTFNPFFLAFLRFVIASIGITVVLVRRKIRLTHIIKPDILPLGLLISGNIALFYLGLPYTTATATGLIYAISPIVVTIAAYLFLHEAISKNKWTGIILGALGIAIIVISPVFDQIHNTLGTIKGNLIILMGTLAWAGYTVYSRHIIAKKHYEPLQLTAVSFYVAAVVFLLLALVSGQWQTDVGIFTLKSTSLVLYTGVLMTVVTYVLHQWAIKHTSASTASLTSYIQPVSATLLAIIILGEQFTLGYIIGSILVFMGLTFATSAQIRGKLFGKK